jgi:ferric-dicitrate binding protein FerR (iron transport regulator)
MKRFRPNCPSSRDLLRGVSRTDGGGASRRVRDHVKNCESCRAEWASFARLADLSRMLPSPEVAPDDLEAVRTALLAESRRPRKPMSWSLWLLWAPVVALVAAAALWLVHGREVRPERLVGPDTPARSSPASLHRGVVHPGNTAVFSSIQGQPDEVVVLRQGEITVEVAHLAERERFRVLTGDAAVEVKGTVFSVTAADDRLVAVAVTRGQVVVRVLGHDPVTLGPNERWDSPFAERRSRPGLRDPIELFKQRNGPSPQSGHARERRLGLVRSDHPTPKASGTQSAAETAFADGWQALRSQRLADAAAAFSRAVDAAGDQPLSEDAWFWLAVCQARIPRTAEAKATLAAFAARFPHSPRIGEAADTLGWLLIDSGDLDGAERAFATAALGSGAGVRSSAKEGLRAVQLRRRAIDDEVPHP